MATESYTPDRLIAGNTDIVSDSAILVSGQNLKRGTLLGKITIGGKLTLCDSSKIDGSQNPYAVLATDTDATVGDKTTGVYKTGDFNERALFYGGADTAATHKEALRDLGIFLKSTMA